MNRVIGVGASAGIAIGRLSYFDNTAAPVPPRLTEDEGAELARFEEARRHAIEHLAELEKKALTKVGPKDSMIFEIHQLMLQDLAYIEQVRSYITHDHFSAEYAVQQTGKKFSRVFEQMDDDYMCERGADVLDVSNRIVRILRGEQAHEFCGAQGRQFIVAAPDLLPSETILLDRSKVLAFVTSSGSRTSHAAILARTMGIPAVVGLGSQLHRMQDGCLAIVDGGNGVVITEPDETVLREYEARRAAYGTYRERLKRLKGTPSRTRDGVEVTVCGNINRAEDVGAVLENDGQGIGLFRTEYLYTDREHFPSEEEQFRAYRKVLERMGGRRVIIRTLDLGTDTLAPYFHMLREENPTMGCRSIRLCLRHREIFEPQLRAMLRASVYGRLAILFPMVVSPDEVRAIRGVLDSCRAQLDREGVPYAEMIELGVMIETPSAAVLSDRLAKEVDFFSFGTNDLTQYTLAVDRMNASISDLFDPCHPAVLRLMRLATENAVKNGIWCGVCGESGSDRRLTEVYLAMGVTQFSVAPSTILEVREKIQSVDLSSVRERVLSAF